MEHTTNEGTVTAKREPALEVQESVIANNETHAVGEQEVEEIDSSPATAKPGKPVSRTVAKQDEPPPNPLLDDPYEWENCTITVGYTLLPNERVSVSVHSHKDEPIVKEFAVNEVPLPVRISSMMATLQRVWPKSAINATVALLPKPKNALERSIITSVRISQDTPIVQDGVESDLPFPALIIAMLEELKTLMPERALKNIEKNANVKTITRTSTTKPAARVTVPATKKANDHSDNLKLF